MKYEALNYPNIIDIVVILLVVLQVAYLNLFKS